MDPADVDEAAAGPPLWICPTCDEPLAARYLRHCEWCGHDFGDGVVPDPLAFGEPEIGRISARVVSVALALGTVVLLVAVYFWSLVAR